MTTEDFTPEGSPKTIRRLLGYAKKYWALIILAFLGLGIGTAFDLAIPLILQKAIDEHILPRYLHVNDGTQDRYLPQGKSQGYPSIDDNIYLRLEGKHEALLLELAIPIYKDGSAKLYVNEIDYQKLSHENRRLVRSSDLEAILSLSVIFVVFLVGSLVANFVQIISTALTGQGVMRDLRMDLLRKTMHQSMSFLQKNPVGKLVTRVSNDVETVNELFTSVLTALVKDVSIMIGVMVLLFTLNTSLALYSLLTIVPVIILLLSFRSWYRRAYRRSRNLISRMNTFLAEHLSGMAIIQLFVRQKKVFEQFSKENRDLQKASLGEMYVFAVFRPLVDLLGSIALALVIWIAGGLVHASFLSLGVIIAFTNLLQRFFEPILDISDKFNILQSAMAGGERVFALLDENEALPDTGQLIPQNIRGDIVFDKVRFAYKKDEYILSDLSFQVQGGEKIAIVGYTGAGKTTIVTVLTRLWDIQGGSISLDGEDIRNYPLKVLRTLIQPIQQDAFFFTDTVRENLCLGKNISDDEIWQALRRVEAEDFVQKLPQGLETVLQEGGTGISGGQRQLLNFARILIQNPPVIIMDEASANIDSETEHKIQHAMAEVLAHRTSLVIAHRLSTIKDAHRILVLEGGEVAEIGRHEELIAQDGRYASLYRLQFGNGPQE